MLPFTSLTLFLVLFAISFRTSAPTQSDGLGSVPLYCWKSYWNSFGVSSTSKCSSPDGAVTFRETRFILRGV